MGVGGGERWLWGEWMLTATCVACAVYVGSFLCA